MQNRNYFLENPVLLDLMQGPEPLVKASEKKKEKERVLVTFPKIPNLPEGVKQDSAGRLFTDIKGNYKETPVTPQYPSDRDYFELCLDAEDDFFTGVATVPTKVSTSKPNPQNISHFLVHSGSFLPDTRRLEIVEVVFNEKLFRKSSFCINGFCCPNEDRTNLLIEEIRKGANYEGRGTPIERVTPTFVRTKPYRVEF